MLFLPLSGRILEYVYVFNVDTYSRPRFCPRAWAPNTFNLVTFAFRMTCDFSGACGPNTSNRVPFPYLDRLYVLESAHPAIDFAELEPDCGAYEEPYSGLYSALRDVTLSHPNLPRRLPCCRAKSTLSSVLTSYFLKLVGAILDEANSGL